MAAPETRVMAEVPSYGEFMDWVKAEVLRPVGEKVLEFEEEQFCAWFGDPWHREKDARGIIWCPRCADSPGFERRGKGGGASTPAMARWEVPCFRSPARGAVVPFPLRWLLLGEGEAVLHLPQV